MTLIELTASVSGALRNIRNQHSAHISKPAQRLENRFVHNLSTAVSWPHKPIIAKKLNHRRSPLRPSLSHNKKPSKRASGCRSVCVNQLGKERRTVRSQILVPPTIDLGEGTPRRRGSLAALQFCGAPLCRCYPHQLYSCIVLHAGRMCLKMPVCF